MTPSATISISQVAELLAGSGYDVAESAPGLLRVSDLQSGVVFQCALEGNVLYMTVNLLSVPKSSLSSELLLLMLSAENGITTSSFRIFDKDGNPHIALTNFCKLQDLGAEDQDDILSLASYLMADVIAARDLLEPPSAA